MEEISDLAKLVITSKCLRVDECEFVEKVVWFISPSLSPRPASESIDASPPEQPDHHEG